MTNVYDGPPDGRQSDDPAMPTSRFRPRYRALSEAEIAHHDAIKTKATELEGLFSQILMLRRGKDDLQVREIALSLTKLEEAVMWAVKGLTA